MTKKQQARLDSLLPNVGQGFTNRIPRWIRCYDNGGKSLDRYTVQYTNVGKSDPRLRGWTVGIGMNSSPFQGIGQHFEFFGRMGYVGKKIEFLDLPPDCQKAVMQDYVEIWGLKELLQ